MRSLPAFFCCILLSLSSAIAQNADLLQLLPQNPHYFLYKGKPTVIVGSGEHYGAVINLDFDYKTYLKTLGKDKLNNTRLFTGAYIEKLGDFGIAKNTLAPAEGRAILPWARSNEPGYALGGNKFDLSKWDEAYFARLKDFMTIADNNGVIVEITLFSSHYGGGWNYSAFNPKNNINRTSEVEGKQVNTLENGNILSHQEKYVRKLVRELNGFGNFYFEIQNEPWADQTEIVLQRNDFGEGPWTDKIQVVSQQSNDWQRKVAEWIKDEENRRPIKHLISQNISNFYYPITDPDPNISIFNFHYTYPRAVAENYYLDKVIGFNETGFAGGGDETYRRQAWRFMMAGGGLFNHLDYSFSVGSENGQDTTYESPGGGSPALRKQFAFLKGFLEGLNLAQLKPDQSSVIAAPGAYALTLSDSNTQWAIYWEPMAVKNNDITFNLPERPYQAAWHDVETGEMISTESFSGGAINVPDGPADKVLVIKAEK